MKEQIMRILSIKITTVLAVFTLALMPLARAEAAATTKLWQSENTLNAGYLTNSNGALFFAGDSKLWKSDGTTAGTPLLAPLRAGGLIDVNGTLFFYVDNEEDGIFDLWKSDGTTAGTVQLRPNLTFVPWFFSLNGNLLFFADDHSTPEEKVALWKSDGTVAGTTEILDLTPTAFPTFVELGGYVYFGAFDPTNADGTELWRTDGTVAGTTLFKDIHTGPDSAFPRSMIKAGNQIFFNAIATGDSNLSLWRTDGTDSGTIQINATPMVTADKRLGVGTDVNGTFFYSSLGSLWKSDGTIAGTGPVDNTRNIRVSSEPTSLINFNGELLFSGNDGTSPIGENRFQLWKSDGTPTGTSLVADPASDGYFQSMFMTQLGSEVYFAALPQAGNHYPLWKTDGTATGTVQVSENNDTRTIETRNVNNVLYYVELTDDGKSSVWRVGSGEPTLTAPTNLQAASPTQSPTLSWDAVSGATQYDLYRDSVLIGSSATNSFADANAPEGDHNYYVIASDGTASSDPSSTITVRVDRTAPVLGMTVWTNNPKPVSGANSTATMTIPATDNLAGITEAEYFIGTNDPGQGNGATMTLTNVQNNGLSADLTTSFGTNFQPGVYAINVRARDAAGVWSAVSVNYLVVFNPSGPLDVAASKKFVPSALNGDILPGLAGNTDNDKADLGFDVANTSTGAIDTNSRFQLSYETGKACNSPNPQNCHSTSFTVTTVTPNVFSWLAISGSNSEFGNFTGQGTLVVDGVTTTNPFTVSATDGNRTTPTSNDAVTLSIYAPGADPATAPVLYRVQLQDAGNWVKIQ